MLRQSRGDNGSGIRLFDGGQGLGKLDQMGFEREPGEEHLTETLAGLLGHEIQHGGGNFFRRADWDEASVV